MRRIALVGFTRVDALVWLAIECRDRGCAMWVSGDHRFAHIGDDSFTIFAPGSTPNPSKFDQIIERQECAA